MMGSLACRVDLVLADQLSGLVRRVHVHVRVLAYVCAHGYVYFVSLLCPLCVDFVCCLLFVVCKCGYVYVYVCFVLCVVSLDWTVCKGSISRAGLVW